MNHKLLSWLVLVFVVLFTLFVYWLQAPPSVVEDAPPQEFSAQRAAIHLSDIAKAPHSGGTPEHQSVREYIIAQCQLMGLKVQVQDTLGANIYSQYAVTSNVKNIIATLKGKNSTGAILVVSHYDSQPNTFGASDDGAALAAKLETIRALKQHNPLDQDVIFLFTDQEEVGLLGAEAFASLHPLMERVKVVLNYESRGNSGLAYCFEVSDENGWIVRQFAKAAKHPIANSMAYEVYKLMPNDTDFTVFRRHQLTGLNQANVDGFVHYHSMTDNVENLDLRIVQHHGDNMLSMLLHLGNMDLQATKAPDITFYNPLGSWMIYYPSVLDLPLVLVAIILLILVIVLAIKARHMTWKQLIWGLLLFLGSIILVLIAVTLLAKALIAINPHYQHFYSYNFYNIHWYILAVMGLWLLINGLIYRKLWRSVGTLGLSLGAFIILALLMIGVQLSLPTASYLFYVPIIGFSLATLVYLKKPTVTTSLWAFGFSFLVALCMWIPVAIVLFVVFSLELPQAAAFLLIVLWAPLMVNMEFIEKHLSGATYKLGVLLMLLGLVGGQINSSINPQRPSQTSLTYLHDFDSRKFSWVSVGNLDEWNSNYVESASQVPFEEINSEWQVWRGSAKAYDLKPAVIEIKSDTVIDGSRQIWFEVIPPAHVTGVQLEFEEEFTLTVDGRKLDKEVKILRVAAIDGKLSIRTEITPTETTPKETSPGNLAFKLICRSWGIPTELLRVPLPSDHIFGAGRYTNAMFTTQSVSL